MAISTFELAFIGADAAAPPLSPRGYELAPLPADIVGVSKPYVAAAMGRPLQFAGGAVLVFSTPDGNRLDYVESTPGGVELWVRCDARTNADVFLMLVCEVARGLRCDLFSPELGARIEPRHRAVVQALTASRAWIYALDPDVFRRDARGPVEP